MVQTIAAGLDTAMSVASWGERESALVVVFATLGYATNTLELSEPIGPLARRFYDRAYTVLDAHRFRFALDQAITDPDVRGVIDRIG